MEHLPKWKCQNKISYISHLSMTLWKQIGFFRFEEKNMLASSSQKNRRCRISSLLLSQFLWKLPPAKGERNDFQPFSASVSIWVENGMVQPRESSCHNKALVLLLMFWHEIVTAIRSAHASLFPGHHLLLISFFFPPNLQKHLQYERVGGGSRGEVGCCNSNGSIFIWKPTLNATWEGQLSGGR